MTARNPQAVRELLGLYRASRYEVRLPGGRRTILAIGKPCPVELNEWSGGQTIACITACNPRSIALPANENRRRQRELVAALKSSSARILPAVGRIPGQPWREPSVLIAGIDLSAIDALARRFEQNAIVGADSSKSARLRLYHDTWRDIGDATDIDFAAGLCRTLGGDWRSLAP